MKSQSIRLMISLVTLLTLCLTLSAGSVSAEGEEYLYVPVEIRNYAEIINTFHSLKHRRKLCFFT